MHVINDSDNSNDNSFIHITAMELPVKDLTEAGLHHYL